MSTATTGARVGLLDGCRTPFTKMGGELASLSVLDLSIAVVREAVRRAAVDPSEIGSMVMGSVAGYGSVPYLARETAIALGWQDLNAYSAETACATSARTAVNAAYEILLGEADIAVAGGAESMSQRPIEVTPRVRDAVRRGSRLPAEEALRSLLALTLDDLLPGEAGITEPYTGKTLGEHAEEIIADWGVPREAIDAFALGSHHKAAAAAREGRLGAELVAIDGRDGEPVTEDKLIRPGTTLEALAGLPPVFDADRGTITAGNASPLTDGAGALILAGEQACERLGRTPKVWIRSWAFTSHDPKLGVLMGPAFALPLAMERAGLTLDQLGLVELHEAFAGQVLANIDALASDEFARARLGRERALGRIDPGLLNVNGGSVAIGHPFGATGARVILQLANEMGRRGVEYGALGICAAGARGAAIVLELAA